MFLLCPSLGEACAAVKPCVLPQFVFLVGHKAGMALQKRKARWTPSRNAELKPGEPEVRCDVPFRNNLVWKLRNLPAELLDLLLGCVQRSRGFAGEWSGCRPPSCGPQCQGALPAAWHPLQCAQYRLQGSNLQGRHQRQRNNPRCSSTRTLEEAGGSFFTLNSPATAGWVQPAAPSPWCFLPRKRCFHFLPQW